MPELVTMGRHFVCNGTGLAEKYDFDIDDAARSALEIIDSENDILLVAERDSKLVGMVSAMLFTVFFSRSCLIAQERAWWIEPEHRGRLGLRLLRELERESQNRGARYLIMMAPPWYGEDLGRLYERLGYGLDDRNYVKAL